MENYRTLQKHDFVQAVKDFDIYTKGYTYYIEGECLDKYLGNCYLIKSLSKGTIDKYPVLFADNRFKKLKGVH